MGAEPDDRCCGAEQIITGTFVEPSFVSPEAVGELAVERAEVPAATPPGPAADGPPAGSVLTVPVPAVPEREPVADDVRPASAAEPSVAPEPNLFELAAAAAADEEPPAEPAADEPPPDGIDDSAEPDRDGRPDAAPLQSANPLDAAQWRSGEPVRLWIDATGRHSVVGVLVGVRGDGTCILDTGSGMVQIQAAALRRRDRDYAEQAAARLAAGLRPVVSR